MTTYASWIASRNLANEASDESVAALLQAVRDNEDAARAVGVDPYRVKLVASALSAGFMGAAGTVGFAQMKLGLRTSLYVQYMPQSRLPILKEFPKAVGADLTAQGKVPA